MDFFKKLLNLPEVASAHGSGIDDLIVYVHLLMGSLFVGWLAFYIYAVIKHRKSANPKADYVGARSHFSSYAEVGVAAIEGVLLLGFAVPLWARAVDKFPEEKDAVVIQIMGQQFAWNAHYAGPDGKWGRQDIQFASATNPFGLDANDPATKDDVTTISNEAFQLPVNKEVICKISSMDVIHCFKVPLMRVTQDAIPGMSITAHFKPTKIGDYTITCAQLCGNGHSKMKGNFKVVSQDDYDKWFASKAKSGSAGASFE
jgi:cytochrome c oxidase subunit II